MNSSAKILSLCAISGGGMVLSLSSIHLTGDIISGISTTPQGILGLSLFFVGLLGLLIHFRKD